MAIKQSKAKAAPAAKVEPKAAAPVQKNQALEDLKSKVSALEAKLAAQEELINSLKNAKPATTSGLSEDVLAELRRYFSTAASRKQQTYWPKL